MVDANRALFTNVAELYDRVRPTYPEQVFDDLVALSGLPANASILEIGCGTGQATLPLAKRGFNLTAVELGADLALVAQRKMAEYPQVEVVVGAFEDWDPAGRIFDLVMAATAFHWIDPAVRFAKSAAVLKPGGSLAVINTDHVFGGDVDFFHEAQGCYERFMPGTRPDLKLQHPDEIPPGSVQNAGAVDQQTEALADSGLFATPVTRRYLWQESYSADGYLDVLRTYSGHLALNPANREALFACLTGLINGSYGGRVRKQYMNELIVATKL